MAIPLRKENYQHLTSASTARCRRKFLRVFPGGFKDRRFLAWERDYKWQTHLKWQEALHRSNFQSQLTLGHAEEIASRAVQIESRTHLLFSFEKMALRDAVKSSGGAKIFAEGLYDFLYGPSTLPERFDRWCNVIDSLPRKQSRVLTWPIATIFGFIAQPETHIYLKPRVTQAAAKVYGFEFEYRSRPSWKTYRSLLNFAATIRKDLGDLYPRDLIDIQSFIWVQGSDEHNDWT